MLRKIEQSRGLRLNQYGDTIVEVLIATLIIGIMLVGAYTLSTNSFKEEQQAEESSQANEILQGQIEQLRAFLQTPAAVFNGTVGNYCMSNDTPSQDSGSITACRFYNTGAPCTGSTCLEPAFHVYISIPTLDFPAPVKDQTYNATATWDEVGGGTAVVNISVII
ncbi:MAG TPA: hypothetical protein VMR34_05920 [Candidatus Saccharimonadales bacterium]|nr:hypothetical protein [Candidatus Saccharimonadales bacterium]